MYISTKPLTKEAYNFIKSQGSSDISKFLAHVISSTLKSDNTYAAIPWNFLDAFFKPKASDFYIEIESSGLFDIRDYCYSENQCREFSVKQHVMDEFFLLNNEVKSDIVNSNTGKIYKPRTSTVDSMKNPYPSLLTSASKSLVNQSINYQAVLDSFREVQNQRSSDFYHLDYLRLMGSTGFYVSEYNFANTGRLFEKGGIQQLSKKYRSKILSSENTFNRNYDLVSSQAACLLHCFKQENIKCEWLETYINDSGFRKSVQYCFNNKSAFKCLLYSTLFGGKIHSSISQMNHKQAGKNLRKDNPSLSDNELDNILISFCNAVEPLQTALDQWTTLITSDEWLRKRVTRQSSNKYFTNMIGMKLELNQFAGYRGKMKRKLAAHILQGMEAKVICSMVVASKQHNVGIGVLCHDGFICDSELNSNLIEVARMQSNITNINITEKRLDE